MDWLEISLEVEPEAGEAISQLFNRFGQGGAVIEERPDRATITVKAFIPPDNGQRLTQLQEALWHLGQIQPLPPARIRELRAEDWSQAWKVHYRPQKIGRLAIVPSWQQPPDGKLVIRLDPGMAFGTGLHPTTRLSLLALQQHLRPGDEVLDMGTGSGILAIAAAKLGAKRVLALDLDPVAVKVARENLLDNNVQDVVNVAEGSLPTLADNDQFHLILVNILADTIRQMLGDGLANHLRSEGWIIASGIIRGQEQELTSILKVKGFHRIRERKRGDWLALIAQKG
ncbi:MAG: 50S ribosomal protein L11 methyltransferase [Chloroflexi bacterium]|nr:50S ribosomal protein L11 methyltransferase [Chloroflexota bacterium]